MKDHASTKPLLLLDIDGVLNAFPPRAGKEYSRLTIDGYPIHLHHEAPAMVSALEQAFEIVWFTLWNHRAAPGFGPHVGLRDVEHLTTSWERGWEAAAAAGYGDPEIRQLMYAKTPLLPGLVDPQRPWVWIDDAHTRWDQEYLETAGLDPRDFRLIGTEAEVGLTWEHVQRAIGFARAEVRELSKEPLSDNPPVAPRFPGSVVGRMDAVDDDDIGAEVDQLEIDVWDFLDQVEADGYGICLHCGGVTRPVAFGFPSGETLDQADRGEVILGGCCPPVESPGLQCPHCEW